LLWLLLFVNINSCTESSEAGTTPIENLFQSVEKVAALSNLFKNDLQLQHTAWKIIKKSAKITEGDVKDALVNPTVPSKKGKLVYTLLLQQLNFTTVEQISEPLEILESAHYCMGYYNEERFLLRADGPKVMQELKFLKSRKPLFNKKLLKLLIITTLNGKEKESVAPKTESMSTSCAFPLLMECSGKWDKLQNQDPQEKDKIKLQDVTKLTKGNKGIVEVRKLFTCSDAVFDDLIGMVKQAEKSEKSHQKKEL